MKWLWIKKHWKVIWYFSFASILLAFYIPRYWTKIAGYASQNRDLLFTIFFLFLFFAPQAKGASMKSRRLWIWIIEHFRVIWYFVLVISLIVYCFLNWAKVIVIAPMSGDSLILIGLLFLLLMPFLKVVELFGSKGELHDVFGAKVRAEEKLDKAIGDAPEGTPEQIKEQVAMREKYSRIKEGM